MSVENRDFIITGLQPWDISIGSNAKDIALEMSKKNRVLYVCTPLDYATLFKNVSSADVVIRKAVIKGKSPELRQINNNLFILNLPFAILPINGLPDGKIFDFFNYLNNKKIYSHVMKYIKELDFKDYVLFIDNDIYRSFYAKKLLSPLLTVYYRRDNMVSEFWQKHAPRLEPLICKSSDMVLANSQYLADMVSGYNANSFDVGQGVDLKDYDVDREYVMPEELKEIKQPIVGYTGWITSKRLDANLLYDVANALADFSFVLVGAEDDYFKAHKLHTLTNVYFIGQKPAETMPSYIKAFDVCINPQLVNQITVGNYPRKIDEYLALGKPTVATQTKAMEMFSNYVWNCESVEQYVNAIRESLQHNSKEEIMSRVNFAKSHTWTNSVDRVYSTIQTHKL